jgi:hypothetical protein
MTVDLQNPLVAWAAVGMAAIALFSQAYGSQGDWFKFFCRPLSEFFRC